MKTKRLGDVTQKVAADFRARGIVVGGRRPPLLFPFQKREAPACSVPLKFPTTHYAFFNTM